MRGLSIAALCCGFAAPQDPKSLEMARQLADESTRQSAVPRIVASGSNTVSQLLSWAKTPPTGVDEHGIYVGLADVFGQLKTEEAIPFLIKNISLDRDDLPAPNIMVENGAGGRGAYARHSRPHQHWPKGI